MKAYYIKVFLCIELAVLGLFGIYYVSSGDALYHRESDGNIGEFYATGDVGELPAGVTAAQTYTSQMDSITAFGVMVSDYARGLTASLHIRLEDVTDGRVLAEGSYPAGGTGTGQYLYLDLPGQCTLARGHQVRVTVSSDGTPGHAPTVLYHAGYQLEPAAVAADATLLVHGAAMSGTMCITVRGQDFVWSGPNYWKLVAAALLLVAVLYWLEALRCMKGKVSYFFGMFTVAKKYGFLVQQLVARDFKTRYKRSVLGVFWSFLNPLLTMAIQYMVFSQLFRSDIQNYPAYLLSGLVVFNFFNEGVGQALLSIVGNAPLITKVYLPKYVYPVTRVLSSGINLTMSLIPLLLVALVTGEAFTKAYLMFPYILFCLLLFTVGLGMLMGTAMVFFRDMQFLWGIIGMLWMYVTPLFYPLSIIPVQVRTAFYYNPMLHFVSAVRAIILEGMAPRPFEIALCTAMALGMLAFGSMVFKKYQDQFVFYI